MSSTSVAFTMLCPQCQKGGVSNVRLTSTGIGHSCSNGHNFNDMDELRAMNPQTVQQHVNRPMQAGIIGMVVNVPAALQSALQQRFGAKLDTAMAAMLGAMLDPDSFVMLGADVQRMAEFIGERLNNSQKIYAKIHGLSKDNADLQDRLSKNSTKSKFGSVSGEEVTFSAIDKNDIAYLETKAKALNKPVAKLVAETVHYVVKNDWIKTS